MTWLPGILSLFSLARLSCVAWRLARAVQSFPC
jgi:hypothetical protein